MILPLAWKNASPAAIFTRTRVPMGKWIHHVQIATVQAELAHPRGDPYVCFLFDQLGAGDERVPGRTAFLLICDGRLRFEISYHNSTTIYVLNWETCPKSFNQLGTSGVSGSCWSVCGYFGITFRK